MINKSASNALLLTVLICCSVCPGIVQSASSNRTPLAAVSVRHIEHAEPQNGAINVSPAVEPEITFDSSIEPRSINQAQLTLVGPEGEVNARTVREPESLSAGLKPSQALLPGSDYTLFISGLRDRDGATIPNQIIGFRTVLLKASNVIRSQIASSNISLDNLPETGWQAGTVWQPSAWNFEHSWNLGSTIPTNLPSDALLKAEEGVTAIAGRVATQDGRPLANVDVAVGQRHTQTDATGRFLLGSIDSGHQEVVVNGRTADAGMAHYGQFVLGVDAAEKTTTTLSQIVWMPVIDEANAVEITSPTTKEVVITTPRIPGLKLVIPAGTVIRERDGRIATKVSITPLPNDRAPFPHALGAPIAFTIQPGGATLVSTDGQALGADLIYPNFHHLPNGSSTAFLNYDPTHKGWFEYAKGHVQKAGQQIASMGRKAVFEFTGSYVCSAGQLCLTGTPDLGRAKSGSCEAAGDPVICSSGTLAYRHKDLYIQDVIPIDIERIYGSGLFATDQLATQSGTYQRSFGFNFQSGYGYFLTYNSDLSQARLTLPSGSQIYYNAVAGVSDTWANTNTPNEFYGSVIKTVSESPLIVKLTLKSGMSYTFQLFNYDADFSLTSITNRAGQSLTFSYNSNNWLQQITSPSGHWVKLSYGYTANGTLRPVPTKIQDDSGRIVSYTYNTYNISSLAYNYDETLLASVTFPDLTTEQYAYTQGTNQPGLPYELQSVTDARGNQTFQITYDSLGRVIYEKLANNGLYSFAYVTDASGQITQTEVSYPNATLRTVSFNANGYSTSDVMTAGGNTLKTVTYNRSLVTNQILSVQDNLGRITSYTYDSMGNIKSLSVTDSTQMQTATSYYTYTTAFNQLASATDSLGHTTSFSYDSAGNLTQTALADGTVFKATYNGYGLPLTLANALGNTFNLAYSGAYLSSITDPVGRTVKFGRDGLSRVTSVMDGLNNVGTTTYDSMDRVTSQKDPNANFTRFVYDSNGNLIQFIRPSGGMTAYTYDVMNNVASITDPLGNSETFAYDELNHLTQHVDRNGSALFVGYDFLERPIIAAYGVIGGGSASNAISTAYPLLYGTANTNLTSTLQLIASLVGLGAPASAQLTSAYASLYQIEAQLPVDIANLVAQDTVTMSYDGGDRLVKINDSQSGTINRSYDFLDDLTSESSPLGATSYAYDLAKRRTSMSSTGGPSLSYFYNAANRLLSFGSGTNTVGYTYDAAGRVNQMNLPSGYRENLSYDGSGQISSLAYYSSSNALIGNLNYVYDGAGRQTSVTGSLAPTVLPATPNAIYTYNLADQMTTVMTRQPGSISLSGVNLTSLLGTTLSAQPQYDKNGSLTSDGTYQYTWDAQGRLSNMVLLPGSLSVGIVPAPSTITSGSLIAFTYDALGRRQTKSINGTETGFLYDGANATQTISLLPTFNPLIAPVTSINATVQGVLSRYPKLTGFGLDEVYSRTSPSTGRTETYLSDGIKSTIALYDSSGANVAKYSYSPYGLSTSSGSSAANNETQYSGRENDGISLYYYRARYYSPILQRFISQDPIGIAGGVNPYAYVGGDPINGIDPTGLICFSRQNIDAASGAVGGLVAGAVGVAATAVLAGGTVTAGPVLAGAAVAGTLGGLAGAAIGSETLRESVSEGVSANYESYGRLTPTLVGLIAGAASGKISSFEHEAGLPSSLSGFSAGAIVGTLGGYAGSLAGGLGGLAGGAVTDVLEGLNDCGCGK